MADVKHTPDRYAVKPVSGMCLGAGGFVVVDNYDGSEWGLTMWREEADKLARQWNVIDRAAIAKATGAARATEGSAT